MENLCKKCGIDKIYKVGGSQAIAVMTFGTNSIPKVDKIFGPGNQYVTEAKKYSMNLPEKLVQNQKMILEMLNII